MSWRFDSGHDQTKGLVAARQDAEEQISVSDRFGFKALDLHTRALQWSQMHGARSGRVRGAGRARFSCGAKYWLGQRLQNKQLTEDAIGLTSA